MSGAGAARVHIMDSVTAWAGRVEILPSLPAFGYSTKLCVRVTVEECGHGGAGAGHASDGLEGGGVAAAQVSRGGGHLGGHCIDDILGKNFDV